MRSPSSLAVPRDPVLIKMHASGLMCFMFYIFIFWFYTLVVANDLINAISFSLLNLLLSVLGSFKRALWFYKRSGFAFAACRIIRGYHLEVPFKHGEVVTKYNLHS